MKALIASAIILAFSVPPTVANEATQPQRFEIIQTTSQTILIDQTSGDTWVLEESSRLQWRAIPRVTDPIVTQDSMGHSEVLPSKLVLKVDSRKSAVAGKQLLVRATVTNPTPIPHDRVSLSLSPGQAAVTGATHEMLHPDGDACVWEIDRLDVGESKVFEAQLVFPKKSVGKRLRIAWSLTDSSGFSESQHAVITVSKTKPIHDRAAVQPQRESADSLPSKNGR